jgi:hypothetical protein
MINNLNKVDIVPITFVTFLAKCKTCQNQWKEKGEYIGDIIPCTPKKEYKTCSKCNKEKEYTHIVNYPILHTIKKIDPLKFKKGFIYILGFNFKSISTYFTDLRFLKDFYKIGKTKNVTNRKKALQTGAPFPTEIIHTIKCEDMNSAEIWLHNKYNNKRSCGEWFNLSETDIITLKEIKYLKPILNK